MSSVVELNEIAKSGYKNFDSLDKNKPYKVYGFDTYKSESYGKKRECVIVEIDNGFLILPERFDDAANKMKKMNIDNLYIVYKGREGQGKKLLIEFLEK